MDCVSQATLTTATCRPVVHHKLHVAVVFDLTPISSQYLGADSPMKSYRLDACDHHGSQSRVLEALLSLQEKGHSSDLCET